MTNPFVPVKILLFLTLERILIKKWTHTTAKKYLTELESLGMLSKDKVGKEFIWFNTELMGILSD